MEHPGTPVVYCSSSISLAILETLARLRSGLFPFNRYLVRVDIPSDVWTGRNILNPPGGWDAIPFGKASTNAGDAWAAGRRSALLLVPSVIVPEESNILINPAHPDARAIVASTVRKWIYDPRLF